MTGRIVIGLGLATVVLCMWMWQATASMPSPRETAANPPKVAARTTPAPILSTAQAHAVNEAPAAEVRAALDDARAHVIAAARPCWTPSTADAPSATPDDTIGRLDVRYQLISDGVEAHVEALTVRRSTIANHGLQACIEKAVAGARWRSAAATKSLPIHDTLRVGELTRQQPPALP